MSAKTGQQLIPLALIALVIVIAFYIFNDQQDSVPVPEAAVPARSEPTDSLPVETAGNNDEPVETSEDVVPGKTAKRIRTIPDTRSTSPGDDETGTKREINWENEFEAQDRLESALSGNIDDAIAISELTDYCRAGYDNENQIRSELSRKVKIVEPGKPISGPLSNGTGETLQFRNFAEYEEFTWNRFAQCQATRGMFNNDLRERLAQLAESGNVQARYLYAMWIPVQASTGSDDLISWMTYQALAMDFTWRNIREGEPLGMLAYGRSLEQIGHVYFTPVHKRYGPAFILAAYKCGLENHVVNQKVNNLTGTWKQRNMVQAISQADDLSDKIVNTFCH